MEKLPGHDLTPGEWKQTALKALMMAGFRAVGIRGGSDPMGFCPKLGYMACMDPKEKPIKEPPQPDTKPEKAPIVDPLNPGAAPKDPIIDPPHPG